MKRYIINNYKFAFYSTLLISPAISFAQNLQALITMATQIGTLVNILRPIMLGLALLFFFWGMAIFLWNAGDSKLREEGKQRMIWSVIAMFVLFSIFGIIQFLSTVFGVPVSCPNGGTYPGC